MHQTPHAARHSTGPATGRDIVNDTAAGLTVPWGSAASGHSMRAVQDYLKAIHDAGGADGRVPTRAISSRLKLRAASVTGMLQRLRAGGWIEYGPHRGACLTARGLAEARRVVRRHQLVECFLIRAFDFDLAEVHAEAEVLEHAISPRPERAIATYLKEPTEGPFGHPIPTDDGRVEGRALRPVGECPAGETVIVREVEDRDPGRLHRWRELGLVPGARVRIVASQPLDGVVEIEFAGRRTRLAPQCLAGVRGELVPP